MKERVQEVHDVYIYRTLDGRSPHRCLCGEIYQSEPQWGTCPNCARSVIHAVKTTDEEYRQSRRTQ